MKVIALPEIQETSDLPCDTGSDIAILRDEFKDKPVDLGLVEKGWDSKKGRWAASSTAIEKRAREARVWLRGREEEDIVVVTHGGFLHFLTEVGVPALARVTISSSISYDRIGGTGLLMCEMN